jgi:hypothetical protein
VPTERLRTGLRAVFLRAIVTSRLGLARETAMAGLFWVVLAPVSFLLSFIVRDFTASGWFFCAHSEHHRFLFSVDRKRATA